MSNYTYGFVNARPDQVDEVWRNMTSRVAETFLGIERLSVDQLYNFPPRVVTGPSGSEILCFALTDGPGNPASGYLIDLIDYAPGSPIGVPVDGMERLETLVELVLDIAHVEGVEGLCIALTDSAEIERIETVREQEFRDAIVRDCVSISPPNVLYILRPEE